jgi:hypothetical protein
MKLPPLSYSFLNDFANCHRKAHHKYVLRDLPKRPETPELAEGIRVHEAFERRLNDGVSVKGFTPAMEALAAPLDAAGAQAEFKLACSVDLKPAAYWGPPDPWLRGKADTLVRKGEAALLVDWKTGKVREDPRELFIQAILVKANFPEVKRLTGAYGWTKENRLGEIYDLSNTDRAVAGTFATYNEAQQCAATETWKPMPNSLCGWCDVVSCEFNRVGKR